MKHLINIISLMALTLSSVACSDNEPQVPTADEPTKHYAIMTLDGGIADYDASRATTTEWHDGDSLFIKFYEGTKEIKAIASYRSETNNWLIECYDFPTEGFTGKCDIVYIAKSVSHDENYVTLDNNSMPYSAIKANYSYVGGSFGVEATLKHDQGRIRFKGDAGTKVVVKGFWYYNRFSIKDRTYSDVEFNDTVTIGSDGYSPYCYGYYPAGLEERIWISHPDGSKFWRKLLTGAMQPGTSGSLLIPTEDEYFSWKKIDYQPLEFEVNGVKFKMMPVEGGTFLMGRNGPDSQSDERPVHKVMLSDYYIAETEVTQALWTAVIGARSDWTDAYGLGDNYPAYRFSDSDIDNFLSRLNYELGTNFRYPSEAEWEYAARGGNKALTQTIYSGSNNVNDVAWHKGNSNSTAHPVASKAPNELGLYDMSGNVWERCNGLRSNTSEYSSGAQTDPYYSSYRRSRGGSWDNDGWESNVYRRVSNQSVYNLGFRMALSVAK